LAIQKFIQIIYQVRDMEGVPLLMNCSRLDACNPCILINFILLLKRLHNIMYEVQMIVILNSTNAVITQWVILAIRNICEGNQENQVLISSLSQEGDPQFLQNGPIRLHPEANGAMRVSYVESSE
jgi:hypothetical protein